MTDQFFPPRLADQDFSHSSAIASRQHFKPQARSQQQATHIANHEYLPIPPPNVDTQKAQKK
jgi:hypothetical protein